MMPATFCWTWTRGRRDRRYARRCCWGRPMVTRPASPVPQQTLMPVTTYPGAEMYPSFSPDGKQVTFPWDGENGVAPGIYATGADTFPVWAPDGKRIAFVRGEPNRGI